MNGNDHVHGLTSQMNALQMSSNSNGSNSYSTAHHDQQYTLPSSGTTNGGHASSQIPTHTAQYTQQPPGWTIRLSHPPAHYIQQVRNYCYSLLDFDKCFFLAYLIHFLDVLLRASISHHQIITYNGLLFSLLF